MKSTARLRGQVAGFTMVELMVALVLGIVVLGGLVTLLVQTNQANRVSTGVARMQENARFAMEMIASDLRQAGTQYCSNYGNQLADGQFDFHRPLMVFHGGGMPHGLPDRATADTGVIPPRPWPLSSAFFIRGHECDDSECLPALNVVGADALTPPALGVAAGSRPLRSDVLTVRYLSGAGVSISPSSAGGPVPFTVVPQATTAEQELDYQPGDLLLASDCTNAQVFLGTIAGNLVTPMASGSVNPLIDVFGPTADGRLFNFTRQFRTVTYFLRAREDPDDPTRLVSTLVRQVNGVAEELVEGIERLDFRYLIDDPVNGRLLLTADQMAAGVSGAGGIVNCQDPPRELSRAEPGGCLWRSVVAIEVALMATSVDEVMPVPMSTYTYSFDDAVEQPLADPMPNGLPRDRALRREFVASIALRGFSR